jgi:putative ABC transport system permease protein
MDAVLGASAARGIVKPDHAGRPWWGHLHRQPWPGRGGHAHGDHPYRVSGVLAPCGCVLDRLILAPNRSGRCTKPPRPTPEDLEILKQEREVVALVRYRTPRPPPLRCQRHTSTGRRASHGSHRLLRLLGVGADVLRAFGGVLLAVAALSVFIALWNAVRERRFDLAMLRMLGAPPGRVAGLVLCEALWLAALASALAAAGPRPGACLGLGAAGARAAARDGRLWLPQEAGCRCWRAGVADWLRCCRPCRPTAPMWPTCWCSPDAALKCRVCFLLFVDLT